MIITYNDNHCTRDQTLLSTQVGPITDVRLQYINGNIQDHAHLAMHYKWCQADNLWALQWQ